MDMNFFAKAAELGGTIFTVTVFLWYLSKRDKALDKTLTKNADAQHGLSLSIQRLTDKLETSSSVVRVNTEVVAKNAEATKENTKVIEKSTNGANGH